MAKGDNCGDKRWVRSDRGKSGNSSSQDPLDPQCYWNVFVSQVSLLDPGKAILLYFVILLHLLLKIFFFFKSFTVKGKESGKKEVLHSPKHTPGPLQPFTPAPGGAFTFK